MTSSPADRTAQPAPRLEVAGLGKRYGAIEALRDVSVTIAPGEIHGLCGHNGAGKSTLVKILSGVTQADSGSIRIDGEEAAFRNPQQAQRGGVALVDQEISLIEALSVADNILLGLHEAPFLLRPGASREFVTALLARVGLADLNPSTPVARLAMGTRQLVEIARALGRDARLLILDEPTATLSETETEHVFAALRPLAAAGTSMIFVSHRLGEVLELCDRVTVLRDGALVAGAETTAGLRRETLVEMMVGAVHDDGVRRQPAAEHAAPSLRIRGLSVGGRLHDFDLDVAPGQIVGLAGQVGSGASECLRALAGLLPGSRGSVAIDGAEHYIASPIRAQRGGILYLSNDRKSEGLFLERSVATNLVATRLGAVSRLGFLRRAAAGRTATALAEVVGLGERRESAVATLSGGNQQKAFLGRCLQRGDAGVLLLDEPTRGVDVAGRAEIHALIRGAAEAGNAVLFASTEGDEILDLAEVIATLRAGRQISVRPRGEVTMAQLVAEMTHAEAGAAA